MLKGFICPDGKKVEIQDCLSKCRLGEHCLTLPTLRLISQEREWKGVASTTQLLNGTMMEYLKLTTPYWIDPDSRAFMLSGTQHHKALEIVAKELGLPSEIALNIDRDIFDLIEVEDGKIVLTDYKLWGSFRVVKALGIIEIGKRPDPNGAVYRTTGKWGKKGSPKMISEFGINPDKIENIEAELQLNRYRIMLEELGIKVNKMQLQVTVRDGGLFISQQRGVFRNIYNIPIPFLDNTMVKDYFKRKESCLQDALLYGWDEPCSEQESWGGRRCKEFCDVAIYCPKGKLVLSLKEAIE